MIKRVLVSILVVVGWAQCEASNIKEMGPPQWDQLTFDYSKEELAYLKELPMPSARITSEQLSQLTQVVNYIVGTRYLSGMDETICPAYIANAQKDFAWLSYLITGELTGDLGPITLWTVQLFTPDAQFPNLEEQNFDPFTSSLAAIVLSKVAKRLNAERQDHADYPMKNGDEKWTPTSPGFRGRKFGTAKTWFLTSSSQFVADEPPKDPAHWQAQANQTIEAQKDLDGEKTQAVYDWAGLTGLTAGSWDAILTEYMDEKQIAVIPQLYIRSLFTSALADSNAASFNSKYTYFVKRPSQIDDAVKPMVKIPNHPSYPSAHSTISATAATILTELFPEDKARWDALAEEAGMSRIWGGIHYPDDHTKGLKLGTEVGNEILKKAQ